jgi:hypothetical protein
MIEPIPSAIERATIGQCMFEFMIEPIPHAIER